MAILKCKMCGADLDVTDITSVVECEYCETNQTIPNSKDEEVANLFNRATMLRAKCEFDKAEATYEKIIELNPNEAEAYWGVILCKFGIEYVEDPTTRKRVPTCHRTSYDAIVTDDYYKSAIEYADSVQRSVYEQEAKLIDNIQKGILAISAQESPYDVFICYKETDEYGKRTKDSAIANEIYYELNKEGLKVFYAAITLEDKLGEAYEPYIFAALNSAKVMLVIGTKPEYLNAVWVKNEWSRFLKIIKKDRSKKLIPCYRDMDAYDLPDEFAHFQAQDMSKLGFISDIVRGIKKLTGKNEVTPSAPQRNTYTSPNQFAGQYGSGTFGGSGVTVDSLLKRAYIFLEDNDFSSASSYAEKCLDQNPELGEAYLIKLLAQLQVRSLERLKVHPQSFANSSYYAKVLRYGDSDLVAKVKEISMERDYNEAIDLGKKCIDDKNYEKAKKLLKGIAGYHDADSILANMEKDRNDALAKEAENIIYNSNLQTIDNAYRYINKITDPSLKEQLEQTCKEKSKDLIYDDATVAMKAGNYRVAARMFARIPDYKDSSFLSEECNKIADREYQLAQKEETDKAALRQRLTLLAQKAYEIKAQEEQIKKAEENSNPKRAKKCRAMIIWMITVLVSTIFVAVAPFFAVLLVVSIIGTIVSVFSYVRKYSPEYFAVFLIVLFVVFIAFVPVIVGYAIKESKQIKKNKKLVEEEKNKLKKLNTTFNDYARGTDPAIRQMILAQIQQGASVSVIVENIVETQIDYI